MDLHLPSPIISKRLRLMLALEVILFLGAYVLITSAFHNLEKQKTEKSIQQQNYTLMTNIQHSFDALDTLTKAPISSDSYAAVPSLWSYLNSPVRRKENPLLFEALLIDKYYQMNLLFPQLNAFFIFDPDGHVLSYKYNNTRYFLLSDLSKDWVESLRESGGSLQFYNQEKLDSIGYNIQGNVLYTGRWLRNFSSSKPAAIIIAGVDISDITISFQSQRLFSSQEFACFSKDGKVLFCSQNMPSYTLEQILQDKEKLPVDFSVNYNKKHEVYSVIATDKKDITKISSFVEFLLLLLIPVIIFANLFIAAFIIRSVIRSYSKMTQEVYQKRISEKDLNLQMLRSQINPHFLYNTLDSMRMAALNAGYAPLSTMCELLAKILRYGVSNSNNLVTVAEEWNHLSEYISLINLRYSHVVIQGNLSPDIMECKMLKLLLQPLVENSINHGIIDDSSEGCIQIWGYRKDDTLTFTVSDNGNGMDKDRLKLLQDYLEDKNTAFTSIGLKNIKKRIHLYYGKEYELTINSRSGQGTSVTLTLPTITSTQQTND